jgi:hypothetical protein
MDLLYSIINIRALKCSLSLSLSSDDGVRASVLFQYKGVVFGVLCLWYGVQYSFCSLFVTNERCDSRG